MIRLTCLRRLLSPCSCKSHSLSLVILFIIVLITFTFILVLSKLYFLTALTR